NLKTIALRTLGRSPMRTRAAFVRTVTQVPNAGDGIELLHPTANYLGWMSPSAKGIFFDSIGHFETKSDAYRCASIGLILLQELTFWRSASSHASTLTSAW